MHPSPSTTYFRAGTGEIPAASYTPEEVGAILQYVLSFLKGGSHVIESAEAKLKLFEGKGASPTTVVEFIDHLVDRGIASKDNAALYAEVTEPSALGSMGPCYGAMWRFYPTAKEEIHRVIAHLTLEDMPADLKERIDRLWEEASEEERDAIQTKDNLAVQLYYSVYDQMHEAILHLRSPQKSTPFMIYNEMPAWRRLTDLPDAANLISGHTTLDVKDKTFSVFLVDNELTLQVCAPAVNDRGDATFLVVFYSILASLLANYLQAREYQVSILHGRIAPQTHSDATYFLSYHEHAPKELLLLEDSHVSVQVD